MVVVTTAGDRVPVVHVPSPAASTGRVSTNTVAGGVPTTRIGVPTGAVIGAVPDRLHGSVTEPSAGSSLGSVDAASTWHDASQIRVSKDKNVSLSRSLCRLCVVPCRPSNFDLRICMMYLYGTITMTKAVSASL